MGFFNIFKKIDIFTVFSDQAGEGAFVASKNTLYPYLYLFLCLHRMFVCYMIR